MEKKLLNKNKIKTKLININECKDWYFDNYNNLTHKSGQFFKVQGVQITGAKTKRLNLGHNLFYSNTGVYLHLLLDLQKKRVLNFY